MTCNDTKISQSGTASMTPRTRGRETDFKEQEGINQIPGLRPSHERERVGRDLIHLSPMTMTGRKSRARAPLVRSMEMSRGGLC